MNNLDLLKVYRFDKKTRCGTLNDGGYVFGEIDEKYDCYISAGIFNEDSFSRDFIKKYNMHEFNSFGFDGSINAYPHQYTTNISFIKKNINSFNDNNNTNLSYLLDNNRNIFIKMDIEGWEYPWILSCSEKQLSNVKQIVLEFHDIGSDKVGASYSDKVKCFEKLNKTHYLIHAHGNNFGKIVNGIPETIELTYLNKNHFKTEPELNTVNLPIKSIDYPNNHNATDINLSFYPFVSK